MSHFPNMFQGGKNLKSWLLQINSQADVVVYRLSDDGKIEDMAAGKLSDVIMYPIQVIHPVCRLEIVSRPDEPTSWGFGVKDYPTTWGKVKRSITGKPSITRALNRRVFDAWHGDLDDYLTGNYWSGKPLSLTVKAHKLDAARRQKDGESEDQ